MFYEKQSSLYWYLQWRREPNNNNDDVLRFVAPARTKSHHWVHIISCSCPVCCSLSLMLFTQCPQCPLRRAELSWHCPRVHLCPLQRHSVGTVTVCLEDHSLGLTVCQTWTWLPFFGLYLLVICIFVCLVTSVGDFCSSQIQKDSFSQNLPYNENVNKVEYTIAYCFYFVR